MENNENALLIKNRKDLDRQERTEQHAGMQKQEK